MKPINWRPFYNLDELMHEEEILDLATDMFELNDAIIVKIHVPEIDPDKIDISVDDDILRISGSRDTETESSDQSYYQREIKSGSFERVIPLPRLVDSSKTQAEYHHGVLRIMLPFKKSSEEKQVKIVKK